MPEFCPIQFCPYYELGDFDLCTNSLNPFTTCTATCVESCLFVEEEDITDAKRDLDVVMSSTDTSASAKFYKTKTKPEKPDPKKVLRVYVG